VLIRVISRVAFLAAKDPVHETTRINKNKEADFDTTSTVGGILQKPKFTDA
jgi:hypothetical protein